MSDNTPLNAMGNPMTPAELEYHLACEARPQAIKDLLAKPMMIITGGDIVQTIEDEIGRALDDAEIVDVVRDFKTYIDDTDYGSLYDIAWKMIEDFSLGGYPEDEE